MKARDTKTPVVTEAELSDEDLARTALSQARIGVWSFDLSSNEVRWTPEMFGLFDVPAILGTVPLEHYVHRIFPEDRRSWGAAVLECARTGRQSRHRFRVQRSDGTLHWLEAVASAHSNHLSGKVVVGTLQDVTSLIENDMRTELALEIMRFGSFKWTVTTNLLEWNAANYAVYGVDPTKFGGAFEAWSSLVLPEDLSDAQAAVEGALKGERDFDHTFRVKRPDGQVRSIGGRGVVIRDTDGQPRMMVGINWDRTEEVEERSRRSEERSRALHLARLASLGEMAGGVAHEINNPLAILLGSIEALRTKAGSDPEFLTKKLAAMEQSASRITAIVKGLQKYARARVGVTKETLSLANSAKEAVRFCERRAERAGVVVHTDLDPAARVRGDAAEIEQLIMNLLANAIDAAQGRPQREVWLEIKKTEDGALIRVRDTGPGLAPGSAQKIFDPFYTTKAPGKGSGLGLSICKGIVEEHGGKIRVVDGAEQTTFEVELPSTDIKVSGPKRTAA